MGGGGVHREAGREVKREEAAGGGRTRERESARAREQGTGCVGGVRVEGRVIQISTNRRVGVRSAPLPRSCGSLQIASCPDIRVPSRLLYTHTARQSDEMAATASELAGCSAKRRRGGLSFGIQANLYSCRRPPLR